ncbi:MAG: T9SS type A sorting domain-containing protein [Sphingobacteriales bacterium]|nr:MAG: T9SS type A sorting domain-containing protein [Sphingobacteriales bacterium]
MKKLLLPARVSLFIISINVSAISFGQLNLEWDAYFAGPGKGHDVAWSITLDRSKNVYVTGSTNGPGTGMDFTTIKYNAAGVQQWVARYNGPGNGEDVAKLIAVDSRGNVYVGGYSTGVSSGFDYTTIKYNAAGVNEWVAHYNGPGNGVDRVNAMKLDREGNVYITGESDGGKTAADYATIKYNNSGTRQWVVRYVGPGKSDVANALAIDGAENVYITGRSSATASEFDVNSDYATIKYNKYGIRLWVRRYDGPSPNNNYDEALAMAVDYSSNIYVTGRSSGSDSKKSDDYATIKYDAKGNEKWIARYNGPGNSVDVAVAIAVDSRTEIIVSGRSSAEPNEKNYDFATIKYNANGQQLWAKRYNGVSNGIDAAKTLVIDKKDNAYIAGLSDWYGTGLVIVKYNRAGLRVWSAKLNEGVTTILVDDQNKMYTTGAISGDYATVKYSQAASDEVYAIEDLNLIVSQSAKLVSTPGKPVVLFNAPNPVTSSTNIYYDIPVDGQAMLEVFDIFGRKIKTLVNTGMKAGSYNVNYDVSGLPNGIYNYRITVSTKTGIWTQTKKLSVAK